MGTLRAMLVLGMLEAFGPLSMDLYLPQLPSSRRRSARPRPWRR